MLQQHTVQNLQDAIQYFQHGENMFPSTAITVTPAHIIIRTPVNVPVSFVFDHTGEIVYTGHNWYTYK
jgi:hypothetical protein